MHRKVVRIDLAKNSKHDYQKLTNWLLKQFSEKRISRNYNNDKALEKINKAIGIYSITNAKLLADDIDCQHNSPEVLNQLAINAIDANYTNLCLALASLLSPSTKEYILACALRNNSIEFISNLVKDLKTSTVDKVLTDTSYIQCSKDALQIISRYTSDKCIHRLFEEALRKNNYQSIEVFSNYVGKQNILNAIEIAILKNNKNLTTVLFNSINLSSENKVEIFKLALDSNKIPAIELLVNNLGTKIIAKTLTEINTTSLNAKVIETVAELTSFSWETSYKEHTYRKLNMLAWAVLNNNMVIVSVLSSAKLGLNKTDHSNFAPLHYACLKQDLRMSEYLIQAGAKLNLIGRVTTRTAKSVLHIAAELSNANLLKLLIKHKANLDTNEQPSNLSAMHYAVINHDLNVLKILVENGADINNAGNSKQNSCNTPLVYAPMTREQYKLITPISLIDCSKINKILDYLLEKGAKVNAFDENYGIYQGSYSALHSAIDAEDIYSFRRLLLRKANVLSPMHYKLSPLDKIKENPKLLKEYENIAKKHEYLRLPAIKTNKED